VAALSGVLKTGHRNRVQSVMSHCEAFLEAPPSTYTSKTGVKGPSHAVDLDFLFLEGNA
jgi:hypothetical protein